MESSMQITVIQIIQKLANPTPGVNQQEIITQLNEIIENNFETYSQTLSKISLDSSLSLQTRVLAVIQLKNCIHSRSLKVMERIQEKWNAKTISDRHELFSNTFSLLDQDSFKAVAPICLTYLCVMEAKSDIWKQLTCKLQENVQTEQASLVLKRSSLMTLGFIAQEMHTHFTDDISSQILSAVAFAIGIDDLKVPASLTLYNVLDSIYDQVSNKEFRDQVLHLIIQLTSESSSSNDSIAVRNKAYGCLVKVADIYYDFLDEYIEGLFNITVQGMSSKDSAEIVMNSIQFWKSICQKEIERLELENALPDQKGQSKPYYSKEVLPHIINLLLHHLKGNEGKQIDGWNPCSSAAYCLTKFAECWKELVLDHVGQFFGQEINKPEWYCKNAAVLALGSVIDQVGEQSVVNTSPVTYPCLIACLSDTQVELRDTVCWVIGKMCKLDPKFIITKKDEILPLLIKQLDDDSKVVKNASIAVTEMMESLAKLWATLQGGDAGLKSNNAQYFYPDEDFIRLIRIFLKNAQKNDVSITVVSYSSILSIMNCIDKNTMGNVAELAFDACFEALQSSIQNSHQTVASSVILTIQTIIELFGDSNTKLCTQILNFITKLAGNMAHVENLNILPDILTLLTIIVSILEDQFAPYFDLAYNLLIIGLKEFKYDIDTCQSALSLLSIMATFLSDKFIKSINTNQMSTIMDFLFKIVSDESEMGFPLKHNVIECFGDLILSAGSQLGEFNKKIADTILLALSSNLASGSACDIYQYKYAVQLYASCMSALSQMIQTLCKPTMHLTRSIVCDLLPAITTHLVNIAITFGSNQEIQLIMTALIGDLCQCFPKEMFNCLKNPLPKELSDKMNLSPTCLISPSNSENIYNSNNSKLTRHFLDGINNLLHRVKCADNKELKEIYQYTTEQMRKAKIEVT